MLSGVLLAIPAAAQDGPHDFPMDKSYKAISIGDLDVQNEAVTLTIARDQSGHLRSSGNAGCNRWTATAMIRDAEIRFDMIATTKMFCAGGRMTVEAAFLGALRSARRWRVEGSRLILEGQGARLVLAAGPAP
jgi:heat shock protein HslJ